jgi:hypothetical protein
LFSPSLLAIGDPPPKKITSIYHYFILCFAKNFNKKKRLELQPTNCAHPVKLAVDAAAEDLPIEENFVCEFGALFRHRFCFFALVA